MADTAFRIASMTKSFTVLAILKLRDEGKLSLEDPVSKWIPEFARMELPTRDSAPLKIRQLLSHSTGFPEDNPWGDQQLSATDDEVTKWLLRGIPFSTPPDTRYEYSNYAFGLLGRVVTRASGVPYEKYVRTQILAKLHMDELYLRVLRAAGQPARRSDIASGRTDPISRSRLCRKALSARRAGCSQRLRIWAGMSRFIYPHGRRATTRRQVPVRRSSVREMSHMWTPSNLTASFSGGKLQAAEAGYGYGLRISTDCRFEHIVGHGGGLPGFGSYMMWLPDYGVGLFAMANLTYSGPSEPISQALDVMLKTGGLRRRELPASPMLAQMREHIFHLWKSWDDAEAKQIASMNLFLDAPVAQRRAEIDETKGRSGRVYRGGTGGGGELAARAVQPDLRERDGRRFLHPLADTTTRGATSCFPQDRVGYGAAQRSHRRASRCRLPRVTSVQQDDR